MYHLDVDFCIWRIAVWTLCAVLVSIPKEDGFWEGGEAHCKEVRAAFTRTTGRNGAKEDADFVFVRGTPHNKELYGPLGLFG